MELQSRGVRIPVQCPDTAKPPVGVSERETGQAERKRKPRAWNQTVSHTTDGKDGRKRQREGRINTECVLIEKHAGAKKKAKEAFWNIPNWQDSREARIRKNLVGSC